jgi:type III restriction enzyme
LITFAEQSEKDIILQSPTGSGKTVILAHFMDEFIARNAKYAFVWLSIGKGDLAEQSRDKMAKYFPMFRTNTVNDILTGGFEENSATFINWEKITKKGNIAISDSERDNLQDKIEKALLSGIKFILIIDEQHLNDTFKATEIKRLFNPVCEIYASATPKNVKDKRLIKIEESEVIGAGLIKKQIIVNKDLQQGFVIDERNANSFDILLNLAITKRQGIVNEFAKLNTRINPLICVQIPNNSSGDPSSALIQNLEKFLATKNITVDNGLLAFWLNGRYDNKDGIEDNFASPIVLIFKQAIATGWDCPRACILVKLRENMDEVFEVQTIGRIRRMPEAKHYNNDILDDCYIYTFDKGFIAGLSKDIYGGEIRKLFLKTIHKPITLKKQYNPDIQNPIDGAKVREVVADYFNSAYNTKPKDYTGNKAKLEASGYIFDANIHINTASGSATVFSELKDTNTLSGSAILSTHIHGRAFHKAVGEVGSAVSLKYEDAITVIRALFIDLSAKAKFKKNLFNFDNKFLYAFIINNFDKLKTDFRNAMNGPNPAQQIIMQPKVNESLWLLPREYDFPIDGTNKRITPYAKNVYEGYTSNVAKRSEPEKKFEKWCEDNKNIVWWYKNGEHNQEYFSIVYSINSGKQKHFYPDYIVIDITGKIWIIETKGGQTSSGVSQNIDPVSSQKFSALMEYLKTHSKTTFGNKIYLLAGGFVRFDCNSQELLINTTIWDEDLSNLIVWKELDKKI